MKLLVESAIIFFGTLMAAGLLALGEPAASDHAAERDAAVMQAVNQLLESARPMVKHAPTAGGSGPLTGWHE